jgi:cytosine/adenosine deaminase-related metal-dependent hydrolase
LLDWLQTWIFPEELKYSDREYSRTAARYFFDALLAGGTTTLPGVYHQQPGLDGGVLRRGGSA